MSNARQQGEVYTRRIDAIPDTHRVVLPESGVYIISHSESGHHHVIDAERAEVREHTGPLPAGMRILYAIVREPTALRQTAPRPHGEMLLEPGIHELRISREFRSLTRQARRVAD